MENSFSNQLDQLSSKAAQVIKKEAEHKSDLKSGLVDFTERRRKKEIKKKVQFFIEEDWMILKIQTKYYNYYIYYKYADHKVPIHVHYALL